MNHPQNHIEGQLAVSCYKCSAGCLHLGYSNVMFTFTPEQFLVFSEIIGEARQNLLQERQRELADDPFANVEELVM